MADHLKFYVNGEIIGEIATTTEYITLKSNVNTSIGSDLGTSHFEGNIYDVRYYDRALNASEIAQVYSGTTLGDEVLQVKDNIINFPISKKESVFDCFIIIITIL